MTNVEPAAIELRQLSFQYPNRRLALDAITCLVPVGERLAIVGPSGAGKSTLLMHMNGLLPAAPTNTDAEAQVFVQGQGVTRTRLRDIRREVGFLFQDPDDQLFCPTVRDDVAFGPLNLGLERAEVIARVERGLAAVGMADCSTRNPAELSTGERKRVCLAGLLACQPSILVLDEPTSNLDPRARRQLLAILREFPGTLIVATHDLDFVIDLCSRVLVLESGKVQADGLTQRILSDPLIMDRHGLEVPWRLR
jgi:cobalt/nickel transport system ATP-binding protein